jgi:hypothetical protein
MEINQLSIDQLLLHLEQKFALERKTSHDILLHLKEIRSRKLYAERGFPNLFAMLVHHFHESEWKKLEIVESITNKTMAQAETELFKHLPETASHPLTSERRVATDATRMNLTVPDDVREMMIRLKELWAHVDPSMDNVEVMRRAFKLALGQVDPIQKKKTRSATERAKHRSTDRLKYYGKEFDRVLWQRAESRCEFVDEKTGRRCDCKFGLQREHVIPLARGGTNELSNMELLCATHNRLRARQIFGGCNQAENQIKDGRRPD